MLEKCKQYLLYIITQGGNCKKFGDWVRSLGWENPLEKGNATRSSILAWRIPWTV